MTYLPFPPNWPMFTPKDKLGNWFKAYASIMELNLWTGTTVKSSSYSPDTKTSTVQHNRSDGGTRIPHHIVLCTGQAGEPQNPTFPNQESFTAQVYHGSQHQDASHSGNVKGKKVIVVGTGNSGHDIAQNFYENCADVTM